MAAGKCARDEAGDFTRGKSMRSEAAKLRPGLVGEHGGNGGIVWVQAQVQGAQGDVARQHAGAELAREEPERRLYGRIAYDAEHPEEGTRRRWAPNIQHVAHPPIIQPLVEACLFRAELVDGLLPSLARASEQGRTQQTKCLEERGELCARAGAELSEPNSQLHLAHGARGHHAVNGESRGLDGEVRGERHRTCMRTSV
eukprot:scaffold16412_cov59-Phaeocystis_antarctica.AAC.9